MKCSLARTAFWDMLIWSDVSHIGCGRASFLGRVTRSRRNATAESQPKWRMRSTNAVLPRSSPPELRQVFVVAADERSEQAKPSANCVVWVTRWVEVDGEESQKRALLYPRGTRSPTAETPKRNVTLDSRPCVQRSVSGPRAVWGVTGIGVARKSLGGSRYQ